MKPEQFGDRLAQERRHKSVIERRDIFKKDVAKAIGASESAVGRWEANLNMPDDDMILALAKYFGVTPAWLRYGQEPRAAEVAHDPRVKPLRQSGQG